MTQMVTRVEDRLVAEVDAMVADGAVASRSQAVRLGLEVLVDRHRRRVAGEQIASAYRRLPESREELAGLSEATRALIAEEPW
jgi:metal-responsive CopG/Arc/MetJ family transcriptional regulator